MVMSRDRINLLRGSAIKIMGGSCKACGETDITALTVHHIIPSGAGRGRGSRERAWDALELAFTDKGFLLCCYCHGMFHSNDNMLWLQQNATEAFKEAMRQDYIDNLDDKWSGKVQLFKESGV